MIYILLSVCCNIIVSIVLKLARCFQIDLQQAITWNYSIAIACSFLLFKPAFPAVDGNVISLIASLGVLLPTLFIVLGLSVRFTGIARTDIAQRLSLFIPLLASWLLFGESFSTYKIGGIILGLIAVLLSIKWHAGSRENSGIWGYLLPLVIFFGMGIIDLLFKQVALLPGLSFTSALPLIFILAFVVSILITIYRLITKKASFGAKHLFWGWVLGLFNFGNIWFYLQAHRSLSENPSIVFSVMNIGVIIAGSLIGIAVFKEKLTKWNYAGLVLAVVSIIIITTS